jgi:RES domain-containing protein
LRLWRLSRHVGLDGRGGLFAAGRWHNQGRPILYTATSPSGALVEVLVHLDVEPEEIPDGYRLIGIDVPDEAMKVARGEPVGDRSSSLDRSRALGDAWLHSCDSIFCRVPSAIISHTENVLINPAHPDMAKVALVIDEPFTFDGRLLGAMD